MMSDSAEAKWWHSQTIQARIMSAQLGFKDPRKNDGVVFRF